MKKRTIIKYLPQGDKFDDTIKILVVAVLVLIVVQLTLQQQAITQDIEPNLSPESTYKCLSKCTDFCEAEETCGPSPLDWCEEIVHTRPRYLEYC